MAEDMPISVSQFVIHGCETLLQRRHVAQWHVYGTTRRQATADAVQAREIERADLGLCIGAGEGNRTLMTSLEGWGSAIELRPRVWRGDKVPAR